MSEDYRNFILGKIAEYFEQELDESKVILCESEHEEECSRSAIKKPEIELKENYSNLRYKIDFKKESCKQKIEDYFNKLIDECNKVEKSSLKDLTLRTKSNSEFVQKLINLPIQFETEFDKVNFTINLEELFGRIEFNIKPIRKLKKVPNLDLIKQKSSLNAHKFNLLSIKQIQNGKIISSAVDLLIKTWDLKSGSLANNQELQVNVSGFKSFDVIGAELIVGCKDGKILSYDLNTGSYLNEIHGSKIPITSLLILDDEEIATGHEDGQIKVWNKETKNSISNFNGHTKSVLCLKRLNFEEILSGSLDKSIKLWELQFGTCKRTFESHTYAVYCIEILDESRFISCSWDKTIKIWDKTETECVRTLDEHKGPVRCIEVFENEDILSCSDDGTIIHWKEGKLYKKIAINSGALNCFTVLQSGEILVGCMSGSIKIWK